jgi:hypothetical protein
MLEEYILAWLVQSHRLPMVYGTPENKITATFVTITIIITYDSKHKTHALAVISIWVTPHGHPGSPATQDTVFDYLQQFSDPWLLVHTSKLKALHDSNPLPLGKPNHLQVTISVANRLLKKQNQ